MQRTKMFHLLLRVVLLGVIGSYLWGCSSSSEPQPAAPQSTTPSDQPLTNEDIVSPANVQMSQVTGRVLDAAGTPVFEAQVFAVGIGAPEMMAITDEKGGYIWALPTGVFTMTAQKEGYVSQTEEIELENSESLTLDFVLQKEP